MPDHKYEMRCFSQRQAIALENTQIDAEQQARDVNSIAGFMERQVKAMERHADATERMAKAMERQAKAMEKIAANIQEGR